MADLGPVLVEISQSPEPANPASVGFGGRYSSSRRIRNPIGRFGGGSGGIFRAVISFARRLMIEACCA